MADHPGFNQSSSPDEPPDIDQEVKGDRNLLIGQAVNSNITNVSGGTNFQNEILGGKVYQAGTINITEQKVNLSDQRNTKLSFFVYQTHRLFQKVSNSNFFRIAACLSIISLFAVFCLKVYQAELKKEIITDNLRIIEKCRTFSGLCPGRIQALEALSKLGEPLEEELFEKADLSEANLQGVNLRHSHLSNAVLYNAILFNSDLSGADMFQTDLRLAELSYSNLTDAILFKAELSGAVFTKANLFKVKAPSANLSFAKLDGADLTQSKLQSANLSGTDLTDASLIDADLRYTNLENANLRNANLQDAIFDKDFITQITKACFWDEAKFSDKVTKLLFRQNRRNANIKCDSWKR